jgi:hypothetical protein
MFLQVIQGKVADAAAFQQASDEWRAKVRPGAIGYLGSTSGVTPDGRAILLARFESAEAAQQNGARPEQTAWWEAAGSKMFEGGATFHDCTVVDTALGGGSDEAGFVQVIQGRAKDQEAMRAMASGMEDELRRARPDILGLLVGWHGDGGFTEAVYFRSVAEARSQESASENTEMNQASADQMDGQPEFFDLESPVFD